MSIRQMVKVWEHEFTRPQQIVMLALADHADDHGRHIYPSVEYLAWKTSYSRRSVQNILGELREVGVLVLEHPASHNRPNEYRFDWSRATPKPPFERGAKTAPLEPEEGCNPREEGCNPRASGVQPVAPEPSLTVNEPSPPPTPPKAERANGDRQQAQQPTVLAEPKQKKRPPERYAIQDPYLMPPKLEGDERVSWKLARMDDNAVMAATALLNSSARLWALVTKLRVLAMPRAPTFHVWLEQLAAWNEGHGSALLESALEQVVTRTDVRDRFALLRAVVERLAATPQAPASPLDDFDELPSGYRFVSPIDGSDQEVSTCHRGIVYTVDPDHPPVKLQQVLRGAPS